MIKFHTIITKKSIPQGMAFGLSILFEPKRNGISMIKRLNMITKKSTPQHMALAKC